MVRQTDQPGIIAGVSSEFAKNSINISFMSVAREVGSCFPAFFPLVSHHDTSSFWGRAGDAHGGCCPHHATPLLRGSQKGRDGCGWGGTAVGFGRPDALAGRGSSAGRPSCARPRLSRPSTSTSWRALPPPPLCPAGPRHPGHHGYRRGRDALCRGAPCCSACPLPQTPPQLPNPCAVAGAVPCFLSPSRASLLPLPSTKSASFCGNSLFLSMLLVPSPPSLGAGGRGHHQDPRRPGGDHLLREARRIGGAPATPRGHLLREARRVNNGPSLPLCGRGGVTALRRPLPHPTLSAPLPDCLSDSLRSPCSRSACCWHRTRSPALASAAHIRSPPHRLRSHACTA